MVCLGHGNTIIGSWSLSNGIPYCLDNQISPPYPESWGEGIHKQTFPQNNEGNAGCEIIEQNIQEEHIHILMVIPPKYAVSDVVGEIKQYTVSKIRKKFAWLGKVYWKETRFWIDGNLKKSMGG